MQVSGVFRIADNFYLLFMEIRGAEVESDRDEGCRGGSRVGKSDPSKYHLERQMGSRIGAALYAAVTWSNILDHR